MICNTPLDVELALISSQKRGISRNYLFERCPEFLTDCLLIPEKKLLKSSGAPTLIKGYDAKKAARTHLARTAFL